MDSSTPIKIAISSCLLGENVRYDGQSKYDSYIVETLGQYVDFVPVCPETGIGMGAPRPAVKLFDRDGHVYALGVDDPDIDITDALTRFGKQQATVLNSISGYIFKSRSPSCGLVDTPIVTNTKETYGSGLYARQITEATPLLPVTDETMLKLESHGNHFLGQALAFNRWQHFMDKPFSPARLRMFHSLHASELERHHADLSSDLTEALTLMKESTADNMPQAYLERFVAILREPMAVQADKLIEQHKQLSEALTQAEQGLTP